MDQNVQAEGKRKCVVFQERETEEEVSVGEEQVWEKGRRKVGGRDQVALHTQLCGHFHHRYVPCASSIGCGT